MMEMSGGRWASKAAISGALVEVWPETMAPCFVAVKEGVSTVVVMLQRKGRSTWAIEGNDAVNGCGFYAVEYDIA